MNPKKWPDEFKKYLSKVENLTELMVEQIREETTQMNKVPHVQFYHNLQKFIVEAVNNK